MTTIHSTDWRASASCRNQAPDFDANVDGETWTERNDRIEAAIATCGKCLVRAQCEADIDPLIDDGIRAGKVLARDDNNVPAGGGRGKISRSGKPLPPIEHNSEKGYGQHRRRGEKPCQLCREAYNRNKVDRVGKAS